MPTNPRTTAGFQWGCPQNCGTSPPRAPEMWAHTLCPGNWSLLSVPFPREQRLGSPWLEGSNFKPGFWADGSRPPPRCTY